MAILPDDSMHGENHIPILLRDSCAKDASNFVQQKCCQTKTKKPGKFCRRIGEQKIFSKSAIKNAPRHALF